MYRTMGKIQETTKENSGFDWKGSRIEFKKLTIKNKLLN